jgi:hypothetical protein
MIEISNRGKIAKFEKCLSNSNSFQCLFLWHHHFFLFSFDSASHYRRCRPMASTSTRPCPRTRPPIRRSRRAVDCRWCRPLECRPQLITFCRLLRGRTLTTSTAAWTTRSLSTSSGPTTTTRTRYPGQKEENRSGSKCRPTWGKYLFYWKQYFMLTFRIQLLMASVIIADIMNQEKFVLFIFVVR